MLSGASKSHRLKDEVSMAAVRLWPSSPSTPHTAHLSPIARNDWYHRHASVAAGSSSRLPTAADTLPGSSRRARPPEGSRALEKLIYRMSRSS